MKSVMRESVELPELQFSTKDRALRPLVARTSRLLASVPGKYLAGLHKVVILNASDLPAREIRKLADEEKGRVLAQYYRRTTHSRAWIELFADRIQDRRIAPWRRLPIIRDLFLASVIFHEVGHHVRLEIEPRHGSSEEQAEYWRRILVGKAFAGRLGLLRAVLKPLASLIRRSRSARKAP